MNPILAEDRRSAWQRSAPNPSRSLLPHTLAAVAVVATLGLAHNAHAAGAPPAAPTVQAGPVTLTFGGFTAAETLYRDKNETADIGSNYNSAIPFPYQANAHLSEFRMSGRQSRFSLLAQGPQMGSMRAEGYFETDFLSSGTSSNSTESNSYTLRVRHFYGLLRDSDMGWYLLAGQNWSFLTLNTSGTLSQRTEQVPLTIDAQYVVGFNWTRNAELRFVKLLGKTAAVGISFESPQAAFSGPTPTTTVLNNTGGSLLNSTASYSIDFAPDIIAKVGFDPGFGHYEVYGLARGFRDRYEPTAGSVAGSNNSTWGSSIGGGLILPSAAAPFYFQASGVFGSGNGRYGSGQMPDATVRPDGTLDAIKESQVLVGVVFKPTPMLQIYVYGGMEQADSAAFTGPKGVAYGYGNPAYNNSGCLLLTGTAATCVANTHTLTQIAVGDWWKVYQGTLGNFQIGLQYSHTDRKAFSGVGGAPSTDINMGFISFRYYPYQR